MIDIDMLVVSFSLHSHCQKGTHLFHMSLEARFVPQWLQLEVNPALQYNTPTWSMHFKFWRMWKSLKFTDPTNSSILDPQTNKWSCATLLNACTRPADIFFCI